MFVPRVIPYDADVFHLTNNGAFSYYDLDQNAKNSVDDINDILISQPKLIIYFSAWEYFYRDEFANEHGFTLGKVLSLIADVGKMACGESWLKDKSIFRPGVTFKEASNCIGEFWIDELYIKGNEVYVDVQHWEEL